MNVLVAGATGYVGQRLVPRLLAAGHQVRALARDPPRAAGRLPAGCQVVQGDVLSPATLRPALEGVEVAYYLVHAMADGEWGFAERDRRAALEFGAAAREAAVKRIVYLGGLGDPNALLSEHLRSRQEVGALLGRAGVPVTELRAAMIVGGGSASFQMLRDLVERVPVLVCPRWVATRCQPIAIDDVIAALLAVLDVPATAGRVLEIGGPEVLTYETLLRRMADALGVHRPIVRVPVLTPRLSAYWVELVTAVPAAVARPLIDGLRSEVTVRDGAAAQLLPPADVSFAVAIRQALAEERSGPRETVATWLRQLPVRLARIARDLVAPPVLSDSRTRFVDASPTAAWQAVTAIGGANGWYAHDWAWRLRGALDRLVGGPGLRADAPRVLIAGGQLDFWRVVEVDPPRRLRLRALMRLPGTAELEFAIYPHGYGSAQVQTAYFAPRGVLGYLYWYALLPSHAFVFGDMASAIARRAVGTQAPLNAPGPSSSGLHTPAARR